MSKKKNKIEIGDFIITSQKLVIRDDKDIKMIGRVDSIDNYRITGEYVENEYLGNDNKVSDSKFFSFNINEAHNNRVSLLRKSKKKKPIIKIETIEKVVEKIVVKKEIIETQTEYYVAEYTTTLVDKFYNWYCNLKKRSKRINTKKTIV